MVNSKIVVCDGKDRKMKSETKKLLKIKRANTEWWVNDRSVVGDNGMTYIAYMNDMGEIHLKELDAKCSKTPSRDVRLTKLNFNYADEHNAPCVCILESGKILVGYTGHATGGQFRYRVTERPYDIFSFGKEKTICFSGSVTYAQMFENTKRTEVWLFCRVDAVNWEFVRSCDGGETFLPPRRFLSSGDGGLFYFNIKKLYLPDACGYRELWFFALYGHPRISSDHAIRTGLFDADGVLYRTDGVTALGVNLLEENGLMDLASLDIVYNSPEGTTVRLLDNAATLPLRVGYATFTLNSTENAYYYSATFQGGKWQTSAPICTVGEFLGEGMMDGSQTYVGGMAYYYGVGEAGLHPCDPAPTVTNRIYIARFDGECRVLESYLSRDGGKRYEREEVLRAIPKEEDIKIWRPIVPIHAQDNLPVYWQEGTYYAHTGGWHSDVLMYVEYDD